MMLYTLDKVRQHYHGRVVLDIDRLEITEGGIHALLGANGAGKSTLLRLLAFLEPPTGGTLFFRGRAVTASTGQLLDLRRRVVLVEQHPIMFSTTVFANIEFGLKIRKIDRRQRQRMVDEALALVGLTRYREARGHELSGGETQRLALARALVLRPEVLLCDEPTASVDAENQGIIADLLRRISSEQGTTIIFTSHDRLQALDLARHSLTLEQGRLASSASHDNIFTAVPRSRADGMLSVLLQDRIELALPDWPPDQQPPDNLRIQIDPSAITLRRADRLEPAGKEHTGSVLLTMADGEDIRVLVNIGVLVTVIMDQATYRREHPGIGDTVRLIFGALRYF